MVTRRAAVTAPQLPTGHPEHIPRHDSLVGQLRWALLVGDDDTLTALLVAEEVCAWVGEQLAWCNRHGHEYHVDDGCRDCP
jgi:hypothetical protein